MEQNPLYLKLSSQLRRAIEGGDYALGDFLPTEHALCKIHDISRHTARAALQKLEDDGLIKRRRGAGTQVISTGTPPAFLQPLNDLSALLQYARDTELNVESHKKIQTLDKNLKASGIKEKKWIKLTGNRTLQSKPIVSTTIYIRDIFGDSSHEYNNLTYAITEHLRKKHGVVINEINQTIEADYLNKSDADLFNLEIGTPVLKTIRDYIDENRKTLVISINHHPSDRFSYRMSYKRT